MPFDHAIGRRPQGFDAHDPRVRTDVRSCARNRRRNARRKPRRARGHIAERFEARRGSRREEFPRPPPAPPEASARRRLFLRPAKNSAGGKTRQSARAIGRSPPERRASGKAPALSISCDTCAQQPPLAAEKMGATGDIENQAMRLVQRRQRRIALATRRQARQNLRDPPRGRLRADDELRQTRARIRQRQARRQARGASAAGLSA